MSPFQQNVVPLPRRTPVATVQGTLALDLGVADPPGPPALAPVPEAAPPATPARASGLEAWAYRFTQAAVEIAGGDRPVTQLLRWVSPTVYDNLARRAQLVRTAAVREPHARRIQQVRPQVASVHTWWLGPETVEVSARVRYGARSRAVAVRFERQAERWQAVALEFA